jgi:hypothetical protein
MATEILKGPLGEVRAASSSGGGTSLTTTAKRIPLPFGTKWIQLIGQGYTTDVVAQFLKNPWLTIVKTTDALATVANMTNASEAMQDGATGTSLSIGAFDVAANGNYLYFGAKRPFAGLDVTVGTVNAISSVLTVKYWNGTSWATTSATDGTASAGATFAQSGLVTWTVPTGWKMAPWNAASGGGETSTGDTKLSIGLAREPYFWVRAEVSVLLTTPATLTGILAINRSTVYAELLSGLPGWEERVTVGPGEDGISCIQARMPANTGKLIVNCAAGGRFQ